jgi:hypothetical protein
MGRRRKPQSMTHEEIATVIEEVADYVANRDYSFDTQILISTAQQALAELRHLEGMQLLNRISLLLLTENGTTNMRYDFVRSTMESMPPLDPAEDSAALRSIAADLRTQA